MGVNPDFFIDQGISGSHWLFQRVSNGERKVAIGAEAEVQKIIVNAIISDYCSECRNIPRAVVVLLEAES